MSTTYRSIVQAVKLLITEKEKNEHFEAMQPMNESNKFEESQKGNNRRKLLFSVVVTNRQRLRKNYSSDLHEILNRGANLCNHF